MVRSYSMICLMVFIIICGQTVLAQSINEDLILGDIGAYKASKNPSSGQGPGILAATGHFYIDHQDMTYRISYYDINIRSGAKVQVTQHTGGDSDQWLLHEVERGYRKAKEMWGIYISPNPLREIDGNKIYYTWGHYRWISNATVICIDYTDFSGTKPEPLEVVNAYLAKYPSTIIGLTIDQTHNEQWIKDEMGRRLWLCDKWFAWQAGDNAEIPETLKNVVKHLGYFLDYRQRYFSMSADQDRIDLTAAQRNNDDTAIMAKLTEYKQWWDGHKGDSISLP